MTAILHTLWNEISLYKNCIFIQISLKLVPKGLIKNKPALVQVMVRHWTSDKPLSEAIMTLFIDKYMHHLAWPQWVNNVILIIDEYKF